MVILAAQQYKKDTKRLCQEEEEDDDDDDDEHQLVVHLVVRESLLDVLSFRDSRHDREILAVISARMAFGSPGTHCRSLRSDSSTAHPLPPGALALMQLTGHVTYQSV